MAKNSTLFSNTPFISDTKKKLKEDALNCESPSDAVIQNILNFSKALKIERSKSIGFVETVLN